MGLHAPDRGLTLPPVPTGEELLPGYEVVSLVRRGDRLATYEVLSTERDCRCVVKVLRADRQHGTACRAALLREGELLLDLAHPHLVRAYEVVEAPRPAVVLETLSGAALGSLIEQGPLDRHDAALLGRQLISVLGYLHRHRWLHLDVKPSNVVVRRGRLVDAGRRGGPTRPGAGGRGHRRLRPRDPAADPGPGRPRRRRDRRRLTPAFGDHAPRWEVRAESFWDVADRPEVDVLVHNLEHGYTILWYDQTVVDDEQALTRVQQIADRYATLGRSPDPATALIAAPWIVADGPSFPDDRH